MRNTVSHRAFRNVRRLGALVASVSLVLGPGVLASPASATHDDPDYAKPTVGECRRYGFDQGMRASENSTPMACSARHTAKVLATPTIPDSLGYGDVKALQSVMARACYPAFREALGRTEALRHKSAYTIFWFLPTSTQREHGARWIRCDLVLQGGTTLRPLPRDTVPILHAAPLPNRVAHCLTGREVRTTCSRTHEWRATGTYRVREDAYPGNRRLSRIAHRRCPSRTSTRSWYATWASRALWKAGDHTMVCYSRRSR